MSRACVVIDSTLLERVLAFVNHAFPMYSESAKGQTVLRWAEGGYFKIDISELNRVLALLTLHELEYEYTKKGLMVEVSITGYTK